MTTIEASHSQKLSTISQDPLVAWQERPVFVAQCHTWQLAGLLGLCVHRFRCLPGYRDQQANEARKQVSDVIRAERKRMARVKVVRARLAEASQHNPATGYVVDAQASLDMRIELYRLQECQEPAYKLLG